MFKDFHNYHVFEDGVVLSPPSRRTNYERRPMLHHVNSKGYHIVQPVINGRQKMIRVHRLIASSPHRLIASSPHRLIASSPIAF